MTTLLMTIAMLCNGATFATRDCQKNYIQCVKNKEKIYQNNFVLPKCRKNITEDCISMPNDYKDYLKLFDKEKALEDCVMESK